MSFIERHVRYQYRPGEEAQLNTHSPLARDLISFWPLNCPNNYATDLVRSNGTPADQPVLGTAADRFTRFHHPSVGSVGWVFDPKGNGRINFGTTSKFEMPGKSYTLFCWAQVSTSLKGIIGKPSFSSGIDEWALYWNGGRAVHRIRDAPTSFTVQTDVLTNNDIHRLVATCQANGAAGEINLYLDGEAVDSPVTCPTWSSLNTASREFMVASTPEDSSGSRLDRLLWDVGIAGRAWSALEVKKEYEEGKYDLFGPERLFFFSAAGSGQIDPHPGTPTLRQVEQIEASLGTSTLDIATNFTTPLLDTTRAFMTTGLRSDVGAAGRILTTGAIDSTTQARHRRTTTLGTVDAISHMAEFTAGVTVEHGSTDGTVASPEAITLIYNFNLDESFVLITRRGGGGATFENQFAFGYLLNDGGVKKLKLEFPSADAAVTYEWQVIQINGASVQRFNGSIASGDQQTLFPLSGSPDLTRTFGIHYVEMATGGTINQVGTRGDFLVADNYRVRRVGTGLVIGEIRAEVVTLPAPFKVQEIEVPFNTSETQIDDTINEVGSAIVLNSSSQVFGTNNGTGNEVQRMAFTGDLTTATNLRTQRGIAGGSGGSAMQFVIDFAPPVSGFQAAWARQSTIGNGFGHA